MIFFDTETVGFTSPLLTIQFSKGFGKPHYWSIWHNRPIDTLRLIEAFCNDTVVAWNLVFDWFQLTKWYNILYVYNQLYPNDLTPDPYKTWAIEDSGPPRQFCLKPKGAIDLMIIARKGRFQHLMKIKPIKIRRIPSDVSQEIIKMIMERIILPEGLQIKITETKNDRRPGLCDLKCEFIGSTGLKYIHRILTGEETYGSWSDFFETVEFGTPYKPWGGYWQSIIETIQKKGYTKEQQIYALRDIDMLQDCFLHLVRDNPVSEGDRIDSELTCVVGATRWCGYSINVELAKKRNPQRNLSIPKSPKAAIAYLSSVMDDNEKLVLSNPKSGKDSSGKDILQLIKKWKLGDQPHPAAIRAEEISAERKGDHYRDLIRKLLAANGMFPDLKVAGTLSNRMAGGSSESTGKLGGSINPQGIDKVGWMREIFTLAWVCSNCRTENYIFLGNEKVCANCLATCELLSAGDFKSFEISIMDAVWKDPKLHEELLLGKKMIALFGVRIFGDSYEAILATDKEGEGGKYDRAKKGFYARAYGGQVAKLSTVFNLDRETTAQRLKSFDEFYGNIAKHYKELEEQFTFFREDYSWREPRQFIETILGFRRYFKSEYSLARAIYQTMGILPTGGIWEKEIRRHEKVQSIHWACRSALCGALYSLQGRIIRQVGNTEIQSPGAEINKRLQHKIWKLQPQGISKWIVRPMNVHDEQEVAHDPTVTDKIEQVVKDFVIEMKKYVPLLAVDWVKNIKNWSEKS